MLINISIIILIALLTVQVLSILCGTGIGPKGHRNMILQNITGIAESVFLLPLSLSLNGIYTVMLVLIASILLICSAFTTRKLLKETQEDIITETLYDVHVSPAGFNNMARQVQGTANGNLRTFILRGPDKKLIPKDCKTCTITYHTSTNRLENIKV